ncbi:MAG: D-xylose transport system permease protein [Thermoleophilaceae bacterium]|jgi:D-xylose transport system permease protein|nr:D-xylose transport system permease protein [Thermoleophilaceae bacterium]
MTEEEQTAGGQPAPAEAPPEETSRFDEVTTSEGIFSGGPLAILARLGSLRVFIVLAIIWIIFQTQNSNFLSSFNLTNLVLQIAAVGMISIGITLILLLGEIDLSVGAVSGLAAAVMAVLNVKHGWGPIPAILAGLGVGFLIGLVNGFFVTQFGIPSFDVTLAGLLAWQGALLRVLGDTGTVNINDAKITGLTGTFYGDGFSWILGGVLIAAYAASGFGERLRRTRAGLAPPPIAGFVGRLVAVAIGTIGAIAVLTSDRGLPLAGLILVSFCALFVFITERTVWGRHVFAVGGNDEAARRSGIPVRRLRMTVFALASTFAAAGGILGAARLQAVNQSSGGSDLLLLAIAGPVIAGTSLFGGRGSVWGALLGALVIGSISNGMDLLGLKSQDKFMITGGVLLVAVVIDALIRNERERAGARR